MGLGLKFVHKMFCELLLICEQRAYINKLAIDLQMCTSCVASISTPSSTTSMRRTTSSDSNGSSPSNRSNCSSAITVRTLRPTSMRSTTSCNAMCSHQLACSLWALFKASSTSKLNAIHTTSLPTRRRCSSCRLISSVFNLSCSSVMFCSHAVRT